MLGLALLYNVHEQVESLSEEFFSAIIDISVIIGGIALLVVLGRVIAYFFKKIPKPSVIDGLREEVFSHQPWLYNKRVIVITAKVERVIDAELLGVARRAFEHFKWALSSQETPYIPRFYQRVLLSSPHLEGGQFITLFHDRANGKFNYSPGAWLEVQGQYIDQKPLIYGFWGSRLTFYGGIYNAYGLHGYVKAIEGEIKPEDVSDIVVMPKVKAPAPKV